MLNILASASGLELLVVYGERRCLIEAIGDGWAEALGCPVLILPSRELAERCLQRFIAGERKPSAERIVVSDLSIDCVRREVVRAGRTTTLTRREYELLRVLAANVDRVMPRELIQLSAWGDDFVSSNIVDVHVGNLRKKIDGPFAKRLIHTVIGFGYALRPGDEAVSNDRTARRRPER